MLFYLVGAAACLAGLWVWAVQQTPRKLDEHGNVMDPTGSSRWKNAIGWAMAKIAVSRETRASKLPKDELERFHKAEDHQFWNESYYFNACDKETRDRVITRISRRGPGGKQAYLLLLLDLRDHGQFALERDHEPVDLTQTDPQSSGVRYTCLEPMRKWRITFSGKLRRGCATPKELSQNQGEMADVEIDLIYERTTPVYWYMRDDKMRTLAYNLSQETWDIDFWKACVSRSANHAHYEDFGSMNGFVAINGNKRVYGTMTSFRDHSWDIRRWQAMDHLFLLLLTFDEPLEIFGYTYTFLDLTLVWMPGSPTLSRYSTGYLLGTEASGAPVLVLTGGTSIRDIPYRTLPSGRREPMDRHELVMYVSTQSSEAETPIRITMEGEPRRLSYFPDDHAFECHEDSVDVTVTNCLTNKSSKAHGTRQSGYRVGDFDPSLGGCG